MCTSFAKGPCPEGGECELRRWDLSHHTDRNATIVEWRKVTDARVLVVEGAASLRNAVFGPTTLILHAAEQGGSASSTLGEYPCVLRWGTFLPQRGWANVKVRSNHKIVEHYSGEVAVTLGPEGVRPPWA